MKNSIMGVPPAYNYEDKIIYDAQNYDEYLPDLFGDWRKHPSNDKQVTHHDYIDVDLKRSFLIEN